MNNKVAIFFILCVFIGFTQLAIFDVSRENWFDTAFSLETANSLNENGWRSIQWGEYDVHPPIYYYVLAGWQWVNPGVDEFIWGQELSVLFALIFLVFVYRSLKILYSGRIAVLTVATMSALVTYIHYATEVRMYMLLMMLASIVVYLLLKEREEYSWVRRSMFVGILMLFPWIHYLSVMIYPVLFVLNGVYNEGDTRKEFMRYILITGILATAFAGLLALQQSGRTVGTWLQPPTISSYPSALFFAFFAIENLVIDWTFLSSTIYYFFIAIMIYVFGYVFYTLYTKKEWEPEEKAQLAFFLPAVLPFFALVALSFGRAVTGGGGFWNLYHHRFFLVVMWMVASVLLAEFYVWMLGQGKKVLKWFAFILLFCVIGLMLWNFNETAHHELENIIASVPCGSERVYVMHESPFSSIPAQVYGRQHKCNWGHVISTRVSEEMGNAGGFDAIKYTQEIYWNGYVPKYSFYYIESTGHAVNISTRNATVIAQDEGIWLKKIE